MGAVGRRRAARDDALADDNPGRLSECFTRDGRPKVRYADRAGAVAAAARFDRQPYRCSTCGAWHTGTAR